MIESQKHLVALGPSSRGLKRYLTLREGKKALLVYLIFEDNNGKRTYKQVTKIQKSTLEKLEDSNGISGDADSYENSLREIISISQGLLQKKKSGTA